MALGDSEKDRFTEEYQRISEFAVDGDQATAIREGGRLFEELCKTLLTAYLPRVSFAVRKNIFEKETQIGKGTKGLAEFTFGQVIGLFREASFTKAIEDVEERSTAALAGVNLDYIADLRNRAVHEGADFQPEDHDTQYVVGSLKIFLLYFGVKVEESKARSSPRTVEELSGMLQETFSSVEVLEGTQSFYRRLSELITKPEIDTLDFTYIVETPPLPSRTSSGDARTEYFGLARDKVLSGKARLRRIVTFDNEPKAAWILFNLVGAHHEVFDTDIRLAYFDARKSSGSTAVMIPNLTLFYSSQDVSNGTAWIYSLQEDDNQNFVGLSGKAVFPAMRRLYASWYRSCDALSEARAVAVYKEKFGAPTTVDDVRALAEKHRQALSLNDEVLEKSIQYWVRRHEIGG